MSVFYEDFTKHADDDFCGRVLYAAVMFLNCGRSCLQAVFVNGFALAAGMGRLKSLKTLTAVHKTAVIFRRFVPEA